MIPDELGSESQHVGPIIFSNLTARQQLLDHGHVVTFRTSARTTGETWWRESRLGEKKGDVTVSHIRKVTPVDEYHLRGEAEESGFESASAWMDAIVDLNGGLPDEGHLYRAVIR